MWDMEVHWGRYFTSIGIYRESKAVSHRDQPILMDESARANGPAKAGAAHQLMEYGSCLQHHDENPTIPTGGSGWFPALNGTHTGDFAGEFTGEFRRIHVYENANVGSEDLGTVESESCVTTA